MEKIKSGTVYLVVDKASKDRTLELCNKLSAQDKRFINVWAPENKNVVDAYLRGYKEALKNNHDYFIEMDAGLSHNPAQLPDFLSQFKTHECVLGTRFQNKGSMSSSFSRRLLSNGGTFISNMLLGTHFSDMTSGYQGFSKQVVKAFVEYPFRSKAHFYQTELRYLIRRKNYIEIPISYQTPSPGVSKSAIINSFTTLLYYFIRRITFRPVAL